MVAVSRPSLGFVCLLIFNTACVFIRRTLEFNFGVSGFLVTSGEGMLVSGKHWSLTYGFDGAQFACVIWQVCQGTVHVASVLRNILLIVSPRLARIIAMLFRSWYWPLARQWRPTICVRSVGGQTQVVCHVFVVAMFLRTFCV